MYLQSINSDKHLPPLRNSYSTVSEDAGIQLRTVAKYALEVMADNTKGFISTTYKLLTSDRVNARY
jgi:hypothetical protein